MLDTVIYDFETLGQKLKTTPILGFACLNYASNGNYSFEELVDMADYIKFDVSEQLDRGLKIEKSTFDWWQEQNDEAQKILKPSKNDKPASTLLEFIHNHVDVANVKKAYTRGNTFDPILLQHRLADFGQEDPFDWWTIRDTRSMIEGMLLGSDIKYNSFIPEDCKDKFIHHNPVHDIAIDVYRMQILRNAILDE